MPQDPQDASVLVQEAQAVAQAQVEKEGRLLPGAYLLVRRNPQTGAPFTYPTAIASWAEAPFASAEDFETFVAQVRGEVERLDAMAVVLSTEAMAEVDTPEGPLPQRVVVLRLEDETGIHWMHAPIEKGVDGGDRVGMFYATPGVPDPIEKPLLS